MFGGMGYGMGAGGWLLMSLLWIALLAVGVWAIARIVPARSGDADEPRSSAEGPREVLDRRLANGEIDIKTYDEVRSKLTSNPPAEMR